jgi:hypothetical protein
MSEQTMKEDEVMNIVFKAMHAANIQMISADHPNNEIHFTPDMKSKWKVVLTPIKG